MYLQEWVQAVGVRLLMGLLVTVLWGQKDVLHVSRLVVFLVLLEAWRLDSSLFGLAEAVAVIAN